ncbi:ABC transporter permease [Anaerocolumna xylanovorans]|uniref:FtsX-like permease family protein n=1 Tax=Anaerocolumna xylanovorans DSM 12503 TaxID=1121345 RepID=A0A1M7Y961_9FIRM|nr:FtsX-like permease family protein [Anaerocolumna xylanovorans]SHO49096.1 FtsX-like permease family protein [Anaerocolumna xylanovorans DSM 12503]
MLKEHNNKVISRIAIRNIKSDKMQSFFSFVTFMVAITLIMAFILTILGVQKETEKDAKMQHQAVFDHIDQNTINIIEQDSQIKKVIILGTLPKVKYNDRFIIQTTYFSNFFYKKLEGKIPHSINEIMVTKESLKYLPEGTSLGKQLSLNLGNGISKYKITAIATLDVEPPNTISIYCTKELLDDFNNGEYKDYSVYLFLKNSQNMEYSQIKDNIYRIAAENNIPDKNIMFSSKYKNLSEKYSSKEIVQMAMVMAVILFAAYLVVYSIFYISVNKKIVEYGQLRAIGMVKKQIYRMVALEGLFIAIPGMIAGVICGAIIGYIIRPRGWYYLNFIIAAITALIFGLITLKISIYSPAKAASLISPIEAIGFNRTSTENIKRHKKSIKYTAFRFAELNLKRNKKKSILTILSLTFCGIIFICCASLQSSISAESMVTTTDFQYGDYKVCFEGNWDIYKELDSEAQNYGKGALQSVNNALTMDLKKKILSINGVKEIKEWFGTTSIFRFENKDISDQTTIWGYSRQDEKKLEIAKVDGTVSYSELIKNNGIIVNTSENLFKDVYGYEPKVGDKVSISFWQSNGTVLTKDFTVMGITGSADGFQHMIRMPVEILQKSADYNLALDWEIITETKYNEEIETNILELLSKYPELTFEKKADYVKNYNNLYGALFFTLYVLVMVLAGFGIISLINLTLTNHTLRKKETSILLSIGMTRRQLQKTRIIENEILVLISLVVATIIGSPISYFVVNSFKGTGAVRQYHFPLGVYLIFYGVIIMIQFILSLYLNRRSSHSLIYDLKRA